MVGFLEAEVVRNMGKKVGRPDDPEKIKKALEKVKELKNG